MKNASTGLKNLLNSNSLFLIADVWDFVLKNGTTLHYTNADLNIVSGLTTYQCNDVLCDGGKVSWTVGLNVSQSDITMTPNQGSTPSMIGSIPFNQALLGGLFDRARVTRSRFFMPTWGDTSLGAVILFVGEITDITQLGQTSAKVTAKDLRYLLNVTMPPRQYMPTCPWVFGDANCTIDRSLFTSTSTVTTRSSFTIGCGLSNGSGFFNNGIITFTSGANNGISRSVKSWTPGLVQLVAPFPNTPAIGDAFAISPGCTKNFSGPIASFNASAIAGSTPNVILTSLTNTAGFFNNGGLQFTSGPNVGQSRTVADWQNSVATLSSPFPNAPNAGDEMVLTSSSTNTQGSCTGFNNTQNFGGERFVPVPETSY